MGRPKVTTKDLARLDEMARAKMDDDPTPAVMATVRQHLGAIAKYRSMGLRWAQIAEAFAEAEILGVSPSSAGNDPASGGALRPVKAETLRSAVHRANEENGKPYELDRGAGGNGDHASMSPGS